MHRTLVPEKDLSRILKTVENPGRYVGGEYGIHCNSDAPFRVGICFPDLYEIGMSNQALAQLYGIVNTTEGAAGERVFTVASDFEESLRIAGIPLYGLDSGTPLSAFDLLTVTFSYELSATNFLAILKAGQVPLRCRDRGEKGPIVLGGGPAATNPLPLGEFLEGVYIGEAEEDFASLLPELISLKRRGAKREDLVQRIRECPSIWYKGKKEKTTRSVFRSFPVAPSYSRWFPVPNLKTAQDHGVVEIMRGCPNGCRFCHAGIFYRPFRMKPFSLVQEEVSWEVLKKGFREISLSSLSSGDYIGISSLMKNLNTCFRDRFVSFSLPSLHIETFGLELLRDISEVRKSGLTFAVETPNPALQRTLNKQADQEQIVRILLRAKEQGWKLAKFYFMIGLPFQNREKEREEIIEFIRSIQKSTGIQIHLNVGTFIPKPHTPFQWAGQLTEAQSLECIQTIRTGLRHLPVKVGYQAPFLSFLEGVICRGDGGVGELIEKAFQEGARFDAWEDKVNRKAWETAFNTAGWDVEFSACSPRPFETDPPWSCIDLGVTPSFLRKEYSRAQSCIETTPCDTSCEHPCGVCNNTLKPQISTNNVESSSIQSIATQSSS
ncbi:MAG TPA: radical SAM protein, partial [Spirochaetales bacterium]|nr:radical SAM protein [Spirochaetales bacterium]